jgi:hypothetical protein
VGGLASQAEIIARIGALGGFYGVDLDPLHEVLATLGPRLARDAVITVPATFDRIAVATRISREQLADIIEPDQRRRLDRLDPDARDVELELETDGTTVTRSVRTHRHRSIDADCEHLASLGVGTLAIDSLRDCAAHLGVPFALTDRAQPDNAEWLLHFAHRNGSDAERATTRAQLLTVARKLAATAPQCNLVDGLHDMLAKDRDSYSALLVNPEQTSLQLSVRWQHVRWETVIRMALGFRPGSDAGQRLGELSGAFDAEQASSVELLLGPGEPPVMRVAVAHS